MSAQALKVLQIEDNAGDARLVRELLREVAADLVDLDRAERLSEGLQKLRVAAYDLVLLDLDLPDAQGVDAIDRLHTEMPDIAIIVLSGLGDEEMAMKAMQLGAQDYLFKGEENGPSVLRAIRYAVERKRFRKALRDERDFLRSVIDSLPDHIYVKDRDGRFIRVNSSASVFFGFGAPEELLGKTDFDLFSRELAQQFSDEERRIMESAQAVVNREANVGGSNGLQHWVLTTKAPLRDGRGEIVGTVGINRDVTTIKKAEERLIAANAELQKAHQELQDTQEHLIEVEKLQMVGQLAAGVAHEVKNPLAVTLRGIEYLSNSPFLSQDAAGNSVLQDMHKAIRRAEKVIRGLLDFAAQRNLSVAPLDVNEALESALLLVKHELDKRHVAVEKDLAECLPPCWLDNHKIQGVFINVFDNAAHVMPKGGTLSVRTYQKTMDGVGAGAGQGQWEQFESGEDVVVIEIEDTGPGVREDTLQKIFTPFFTTKPAGQGTGLGLSVSKTVVELHGGSIELSNRAQGGAKVVIIFRPDGARHHEESQPADPVFQSFSQNI